MTTEILPCVEIEPSGPARASIVWLHGLGADGHDFEAIIPALGLPDTLGMRFVFPHAPVQRVSLNAGMRMRAWYDIIPDPAAPEDAAGIRASEQAVRALIEREAARGVPSERVIIAGFSQGGAIALQTAIRYPQRLAGVIALSTYLPLASTLPSEAQAVNIALPIFMAHGTEDGIVPYAAGARSRDLLEAQGYRVTWHSYPMAHSVCPEEVADIAAWLRDVLKAA